MGSAIDSSKPFFVHRDGNREFAQFVSISKGAVGEIRAQLLYALDLGYLEREKFEQLNALGKRGCKIPERINASPESIGTPRPQIQEK